MKESKPRIMACLFHQSVEAVQIHKVKETNGPLWIDYGLCLQCEGDLMLDRHRFAIEIDKEICKNLNKRGI